MQERSTIEYSIVCNFISPPPTEIVKNKKECSLKLKILVDFHYHYLLSSYGAFNFNTTNLNDFSNSSFINPITF